MKDQIDYKTKSFTLRPDSDNSWSAATNYLAKHDKENLGLVVTHLGTLRTYNQNSSIHLYCKWLAVALNEAGHYNVKKLFNNRIEMPWHETSVKVDIWHPVQFAMYPEAVNGSGEPSTAKLNTAQVSQVYDVISMNVAQSKGVSVSFPDKYGQAFSGGF